MTFLKQCGQIVPEESVNFLYAVNRAVRMKGVRFIQQRCKEIKGKHIQNHGRIEMTL
jgi:hypothetical protein